MNPLDLRVRVDDDGIRPAGRPDECFYCRRRIGELHKLDCVMLHQEVECRATFKNLDADNVFTFRSLEPFSWTKHDIEFHFNDSSWCCDNIEHVGDRPDVIERAKALLDEGHCLCFKMHVDLVRVVDPGPFVVGREYNRPLTRANAESLEKHYAQEARRAKRAARVADTRLLTNVWPSPKKKRES